VAENKRSRGSTRDSAASRHRVEWIVGSIGLVIVLGVVVFLVVQWLQVTFNPLPLSFSFRVISIDRAGDRHVVKFKVLNQGTSTVAALLVEGSLVQGGKVIETSEANFDYVPSRSEREGGLLFANDPRAFRLTLQPKGYSLP
jgi:uncharacterized protein (TIGR02588 family)